LPGKLSFSLLFGINIYYFLFKMYAIFSVNGLNDFMFILKPTKGQHHIKKYIYLCNPIK